MSQPNADWENSEREDRGAPNSAEQDHPLVVLAIDDDPGILKFYQGVMTRLGVHFEGTTDPKQAMDLVAAHDPSLVILDLAMPGVHGMDLLRQIKDRDPQTRVVMITGKYTIDTAVKAIQDGAIDYLCKPVSLQKLQELVTRVRSLVAKEVRTRSLERELADVSNLEGIIGHSPRMGEVCDLVQGVASHFHTALILGEPGSGRKTVARALHNLSPARGQRFSIFKSEVSTEKPVDSQPAQQEGGGFTGAVVCESELFGPAISGTVFLDEVGDLSADTQIRLLRLLDQVAARDAGVPLAIQKDLRVIASSSRDLELETKAGGFRADLWYRLSMVQIHLPALRERAEDVLLLARHFLAKFSAEYGKAVQRLSRGAEAALLAYSWPGNVSELENVIGRGCLLTEGNVLDCGGLPAGLVLPDCGGGASFRDGRGLNTDPTNQKSSSTETLRQKVQEIFDRSRNKSVSAGTQ